MSLQPLEHAIIKENSEIKGRKRVVDVNVKSGQLDFIKFQNFYVASLKLEQIQAGESQELHQVLLSHYPLMKNPHFENDSQDWHVVSASDFLHPIDMTLPSITLRFTLSQPSAIWEEFEIRELEFYKKIPPIEESDHMIPPAPSVIKDKALQAAVANLDMILTQLNAEAETLATLIG